jgi:Putative peptidoglycan binding domain
MKTLVILACSLALACGAYAQPEQGKPQKKKQTQPVQHAPPTTGHPTGARVTGKKPSTKAYGNKGGQSSMGPHNQNFQHTPTVQHYQQTGKHGNKWQNQGGNISSSATNTKFNKSKTVNKSVTVNKNYKIQQFNVSKNGNPKYQAVKFNQNYHIAGAHNWHGSQYVVFANYHPAWHDQWWWGSHYGNHLVFILGGWYYWNANYWYPAWGYDPGAVYYFDGPIYASHPDVDPGQVVANVQSALQQEGYYQGDIDGILGPQTRAALAEYQSAQGLEPTGAVDEPTLQTLGMA